MTTKRRFYLYIALTVLMMALIFFQSALPADLSQTESDLISEFLAKIFHWDPEMASFLVRKTAHCLEYAILGVLLTLTVGAARGKDTFSWALILLPWAIGTFYAVTDEFHQHFVEGRSCELRDMAIDLFGVLLGVCIVLIISWLRKKNHSGTA